MDQSEPNWRRIAKARAEGTSTEERDFAAERFIRFLNLSKIELPGGAPLQDVLKSRDSIRDFVLSLEYKHYARLLVGINGIVRLKSGEEDWSMDGEGVLMGDDNIFPDQTDKEALLARSLESAKEMAREGRTTEDISIQLAVSLTAIHPFIDGNGRTAKFLFTILNAGYDPQLLKEVLTSDGFSNAVNAMLFQATATAVLDPEHKLINEKFETWLAESENRKKVAELIIDIIQNDTDQRYESGNVSTLDYFKQQLLDAKDSNNLYERILKKSK